ncbi:energy transducer TonB [Sphingobacterium sp. HJSM2_6]|uniref:energy transducer TonB n=1 Tax=Sphingobacterium sp. HJSM2_6 TaxID=3366264 RepID=UPI003BE39B4D
MIISKLDLFKKEWLDVVFENRNKEYGAYELRKFAPRATNIALTAVSSVVLLFVGIKAFNIEIFQKSNQVTEQITTPVTLEDLEVPPALEEEEPLPLEEQLPQQIAIDPPAMELIRLPEPIIVSANKVTEEPATQEDFKKNDATPARLTLSAVPGGTAVPVGEFGSKKVDGKITGGTHGDVDGNSNEILDFISVQVQPEYPGGIEAFRKFVQSNLVYPQSAIEAGVKGVVQVSFVIDKNGAITELNIDKDLSHGIGQAAVTAIKKAKKWEPAIQNGRKVPVKYSLPIRLDLSQM